MKRRTMVAVVLVLAFALAPVANAAVTMVWSRFQAVKAAIIFIRLSRFKGKE